MWMNNLGSCNVPLYAYPETNVGSEALKIYNKILKKFWEVDLRGPRYLGTFC